MFALQMVTQLVTKEKFLEVAARRASIASEAMSSAAAGGGLLAARGGIKGLFPLLGRLALGFVKFLGPIGWITTAATLGFVAFNKYRDAQEKSRVELEKLSIVAKTSKEEIAAYGEIFGFAPNKLPSQRTNATTLRQDKRSEVDRLRSNDKFISENKQIIDILKKGGLSQGDALTALTSKGLMLRAAGASEAQVQTILTALAEESGRKDLVLNFKKQGLQNRR